MANGSNEQFTTFALAGIGIIGFLASRNGGDGDGDGNGDTPDNQAPQASFTYGTDDVVGSITAESTSSDPEGRNLDHDWELITGGSTVETAGGAVATFMVPDPSKQYSVRLTVTDPEGLDDVTTETGIGPFETGPDLSGVQPDFVVEWDPGGYWVIDGRPSDLDGYQLEEFHAEGEGPTSWTRDWDGNGSVITTSTASEGVYTITLTVILEIDGDEYTKSTTRDVEFVEGGSGNGNGGENTSPTAQFSWDVDFPAGSTAQLQVDGSPSSDPDGSIDEYHFAVYDGSTLVDESSGPGPQRAFTLDHGTYTVDLEVTDDDGATDTETKQVDVTGDGNGNGNGNGGITAVASATEDVGDIVLDASGSSGDIQTYSWSVLDSGGSLVASRGGETATVEDASPGTYSVELSVTGASGDFDGDSTTVTVQGPGGSFDHLLQVWPAMDAGGAPSAFLDATVSGGAERVSGNVSVSGNALSYSPTDGSGAEVAFDGELEFMHWQGFTPRVDIDGDRQDPFDFAYNLNPDLLAGPRNVWIASDAVNETVAEITIYTTQALYDKDGWAPARSVGNYLAGSLREHGVSHDILFDLGPIQIPSQNTDCGTDDTPASAHDYWKGELNNSDGHPDVIGDTYTTRKDSNLLLTDWPGGGCGETHPLGNVATSGAAGFGSTVKEWPGPPATEPGINRIYPAMHEVAHNFGYSHPGDGSESGGEGWYEGFIWHQTPATPVPGNTNVCGVSTPERYDPEDGVVNHLHYSDCTISEIIVPGIRGGRQGNTETAVATGVTSHDCPGCRAAMGSRPSHTR